MKIIALSFKQCIKRFAMVLLFLAAIEVAASAQQIVAQVGGEKITADLLTFVIQESLTKEKDPAEILDLMIEDLVLSKEAVRMGLHESPLVKQRLQREREHVYVTCNLKMREPAKKLSSLRRDFGRLSKDYLLDVTRGARVVYQNLNWEQVLPEVRKSESERARLVLAKIDNQPVTLNDILDLLPAYKEQRLMDMNDEARNELILKAYRMKRIKQDFENNVRNRAVLKEYLRMAENNILANAVRGLYLDPLAKFTKGETTDEKFEIKIETPSKAKLEQYYNMNREKFRIVDSVRLRHAAVEKKEHVEELLNQVAGQKIRTEQDFVRTVRTYSISPDRARDGDIGVIKNPILYPDSKLPNFIPWIIAKTKLFGLKKSETFGPFRSDNTQHMLFVSDRTETIVPFSSEYAQQLALRYWKLEKKRSNLSTLIAKLRTQAGILIDDAILRDIHRKTSG